MVKYNNLNSIFSSLADPVRRDIVDRVSRGELTVTEIAKPYSMSLPAVSKHLRVLQAARLIKKQKRGKQQYVTLSPVAVQQAATYLQHYHQFWEDKLDSLERHLKKKGNKA